MIEKLKYNERQIGGEDMVLRTEQIPAQPWEIQDKINELVDAVNELQSRAENVQLDTESRQENVRKETFISIDEALNTATAKELARTRKALDVAVDALKEICAGVPSDKWVFDTANKAINESTKKEEK